MTSNPIIEGIKGVQRATDVGRLIAAGRKARAWSQAQLAELVGVSRKTISDLERGEGHHASLTTALKALSLTGFSVDIIPHRRPDIEEILRIRAAVRNDAAESPRILKTKGSSGA